MRRSNLVNNLWTRLPRSLMSLAMTGRVHL